MAELDRRLLTVSLEIDGKLKKFDQNLDIVAKGTKYASSLQGDTTIRVTNLNAADRNYLLTALSPFSLNRTPKLCIIEAGRESTGLSEIYRGNVAACKPTQPPDIALDLTCQTAQFQKGNIIATQQQGSVALSQIAKQVAADTGLTLTFEATDKQITNYSFTGAALKQVDRLAQLGQVNVYVDGTKLIVKDWNVPLKGLIRVLAADSGMIGVPDLTEFGIRVVYLLDNQSTLGGALRIKSSVYPVVNGDYTISQLSFDLSSRAVPFYWIADCVRKAEGGGAVIPYNPGRL